MGLLDAFDVMWLPDQQERERQLAAQMQQAELQMLKRLANGPAYDAEIARITQERYYRREMEQRQMEQRQQADRKFEARLLHNSTPKEQLMIALHKIFGTGLPDFLDAIRQETASKVSGSAYPSYLRPVELNFTYDLGADAVILTDSLGGHVRMSPQGHYLGDPRQQAKSVWAQLCASRKHQPPRLEVTLPLDGSYLGASVEDTIQCGRKLLAEVAG